MNNSQDKVKFIWGIVELLKGPFKKEEYGKIILPMVVLRRFDCILEEEVPKLSNVSKLSFKKLLIDADSIADNLINYINELSKDFSNIIEYFDFKSQIEKMDKNNLLYAIIKSFSELNLHLEVVSNLEMGYIFEQLVRKFFENSQVEDHYTPHDVIRLMVNLLFMKDDDILTRPGITQTFYDCCAGTGGMGSASQEYLKELNPTAQLEIFTQEIDEEAYAICTADTLIKGQESKNITFGDTLANDNFPNKHFNYMSTNPPYGVAWKNIEDIIIKEFEEKGFNGRFGAGIPRISDGQLLFLQHLISKMRPVGIGESEQGSRIAIIMNSSPLYTGDAGSGESEIRRFVIENDLLEGIVAIPEQLFYSTGISTYIWILSNNKNASREGKIQLVNGTSFYKKMKESFVNKKNELTKEDINQISRMYEEYREGENCKIFDNEDFGYRKIVIERPLRLSFRAQEDRVKQLYNQTAFVNIALCKKKGEAGLLQVEEGKNLQDEIIRGLNGIGNLVYKNREEFTKIVKKVFNDKEIAVSGAVLKIILAVLSEKDETADICVDSKGYPEVDTDLTDTENVPLKEDIYKYFEKEVKPYVPDAWIDESKRMIGYEIAFERQFHKCTPLRGSKEIMLEIKQLEERIGADLKKVLG